MDDTVHFKCSTFYKQSRQRMLLTRKLMISEQLSTNKRKLSDRIRGGLSQHSSLTLFSVWDFVKILSWHYIQLKEMFSIGERFSYPRGGSCGKFLSYKLNQGSLLRIKYCIHLVGFRIENKSNSEEWECYMDIARNMPCHGGIFLCKQHKPECVLLGWWERSPPEYRIDVLFPWFRVLTWGSLEDHSEIYRQRRE